MYTAEMVQAHPRFHFTQSIDKPGRIRSHECRGPTGFGSRLTRGLTDTKCGTPLSRGCETDRIGGCEDNAVLQSDRRRGTGLHNLDQRAEDDIDPRQKRRIKRLEKGFIGPLRSGHDHRDTRCVHFSATGLFALADGVTCGGIGMQRGLMVAETLTVLGLESSCDDTAAAVLRRFPGGSTEILASIVKSQTGLHADFGGVVPEIAARAHTEILDFCVEQAVATAQVSLSDIDAIAVTAGPGLIGGVVAGVMLAKGLCVALEKPLYGINHLAGHALTPRLTNKVAYPYLMLLVSGGHCQFLIVRGADDFERLGGTIDDAPGEAFDKVARLLGLPQPGGPAVEAAALKGDPGRYPLPRPLLDRDGCDLSFSGLKTAVLRLRDRVAAENGGLHEQDRADICAAFQAAVVDVLGEKTQRAMTRYATCNPTALSLCVAGGVAANMAIRHVLETVASRFDAAFVAPPLALCTDNAAMIAYAAMEQMVLRPADDLSLSARPRWPLDVTSPAMLGSGKKGAKA